MTELAGLICVQCTQMTLRWVAATVVHEMVKVSQYTVTKGQSLRWELVLSFLS